VWVLAALGLHGCGGDAATGETSVFLVVVNMAGAVRPDEVQLAAYEGSAITPREAVNRRVAPGTSAALGDLVVFPQAGTPSIRFVAQGLLGGNLVSQGEATALPQVNKQVRAELTLAMLPDNRADAGFLPGLDGGVPPMGGEGGGGGQGGQGGADPDARESPDAEDSDAGVDGGAEPDTQPSPDVAPDVMPKKMLGETCGGGAQCQSGVCDDGVCCDQECPGDCQSCRPSGQPAGLCTPLPQGTECGPDPRCLGGGPNRRLEWSVCNGASTCQMMTRMCSGNACNADTLMCM
jgi:hypothetical protein